MAPPMPATQTRAMSVVAVPATAARRPSALMQRHMSVMAQQQSTPTIGHVIIFMKGLLHMIAVEGDEDESWSEQSIMGQGGEIVGKLLCRMYALITILQCNKHSSIQADVDFDTEEILLEGTAEDVMQVWKTWKEERKHVRITIQLYKATGDEPFLFNCYSQW